MARQESASDPIQPWLYDLVLADGQLYDPVSMKTETTDVAFMGGSVSAIGPDLDRAAARRVVQLDGDYVLPGLVDIHTHVFHGIGESTSADEACLARGTTTAVDGGSAGANTFEAFRVLAVKSRTRVLAWLNISTIGQVDTRVGELMSILHLDVAAATDVARRNPDLIVGFKARLSTYVAGGACIPALELLMDAANATDLPVMVHIGDTAEPLEDILPRLRPGDVVTHALTGRRNGLVKPDGRLLPEAAGARSRGVLFDAARGRNHLSFRVLETLVEQGFIPDTLSTDVTRLLTRDSGYHLGLMATYLLAFGVPLEDVLPRITLRPALAIGRADLGVLVHGGPGDATVMRLDTGTFRLQDVDGVSRNANHFLVPVAAVREGRYRKLRAAPAGSC